MVELEYYGGDGFGSCPDVGVFEVRTETENKQFTKLDEAMEYYESLNESKFFWDLTRSAELIDAYTVKETK